MQPSRGLSSRRLTSTPENAKQADDDRKTDLINAEAKVAHAGEVLLEELIVAHLGALLEDEGGNETEWAQKPR